MRSGLPIIVNWTSSLCRTAEALWAKIDRKSAISLQCGHFDPKFQVEEVAPTRHFRMDRLIGKRVGDFLLVLIELFSLC